MAEIVTFVRQEQQDNQDPHEKIVAELGNGKYYQILLTPEEQHRCTVDAEYLREVLLKAEHESALQNCYDVEETININDDTSPGNAATWSNEKILLLLALVKEISPHTQNNVSDQQHGWDAIVDIFNQNGYTESADTISQKWFNLKEMYMKYMIIKNTIRSSHSEHVTWPYFETIGDIMGHQDDVISPTENLLSSLALNSHGTVRTSCPSAEDSCSTSNYESCSERKQAKRRKKQMTGRSKKRRLRGKVNDQAVHKAPGWFAAYQKGAKDERKWREEISDIMKDGNNAVKLLVASIAEFARK